MWPSIDLRGGLCATAIVILALSLSPIPAAATTIQVAAGAPDVLATDGTCSLREAIINANDDDATWPDCPAGSGPDTIVLPAGTYVLAIPGSDEDAAATGDLDILDDLTLVGAGPAMTTIDAAGLDRVLDVRATASVDGVTITGGVATDASGGGIQVVGGESFSLGNTTVSGNSARLGGGLLLFGGILKARSVVVSENTADYGGGICAVLPVDSESKIESSAIHGNQALYQGGGLHIAGRMMMVDTSVFENVADDGGGIFAQYFFAAEVRVDLQTSAVFANTAARGAGVSLLGKSGRPEIFANLFATNSSISENLGEGIFMSTGISELQYATVAGNSGGAFRTGNDGIVYLSASIVANQDLEVNCAGDDLQVVPGGYNLDSDGTCNLTGPTNLPNTDPMLGPLQDNGGPTFTQALLPGSPAIDAIPCTYTFEDQRGVARPQGENCDIGAYEVTACGDGVDNDGDGFIDHPEDPGCRDATSVREDPQCQDGIDNDGDGLTDFDGGLSALGYVAADPDPNCATPYKNSEAASSSKCGLGAELALLLPPLMMWCSRRRRSR